MNKPKKAKTTIAKRKRKKEPFIKNSEGFKDTFTQMSSHRLTQVPSQWTETSPNKCVFIYFEFGVCVCFFSERCK